MICREEVSPEWRERLGACGLHGLAPLLGRAGELRDLEGGWEHLTKPGLGRRERWRWRLADTANSPVLYLKRYRRTPLRQQLDRIRRQCAWRSRAYWEYAQACRLAESHIGVPPPVGFVEDMLGVLERRSAVLLGPAPGDGFDRLWTRLQRGGAPITRGMARRDLAVRLGRFIAAFHGTGLCHRDLYLCHVFADLDPRGRRSPRFSLIDLARIHRPRWRRARWLVKDLAQLDASARRIGATRTDRWRFLLAYLNLRRGAARARWYARRILRKSDSILQRDARKSQSA